MRSLWANLFLEALTCAQTISWYAVNVELIHNPPVVASAAAARHQCLIHPVPRGAGLHLDSRQKMAAEITAGAYTNI